MELSALQQRILSILREKKDWMSRAELAQALNRPNRLIPYDVTTTEELIAMGLVEQKTEIVGTVKTVIKYRAK